MDLIIRFCGYFDIPVDLLDYLYHKVLQRKESDNVTLYHLTTEALLKS